jgi:hypothetical protein
MTYTLPEVMADPAILDEVESELRTLRQRVAALDERLRATEADRDPWREQARRRWRRPGG